MRTNKGDSIMVAYQLNGTELFIRCDVSNTNLEWKSWMICHEWFVLIVQYSSAESIDDGDRVV